MCAGGEGGHTRTELISQPHGGDKNRSDHRGVCLAGQHINVAETTAACQPAFTDHQLHQQRDSVKIGTE